MKKKKNKYYSLHFIELNSRLDNLREYLHYLYYIKNNKNSDYRNLIEGVKHGDKKN